MDVKLILKIRIFAVSLIIASCLASLASMLFVAKSTALSIMLWPLFLGMPLIIFPPLMAKPCPKCGGYFFGRFLSMDILTSWCKSCGKIL